MERAKNLIPHSAEATKKTKVSNAKILSIWMDILNYPEWPTEKFLNDLVESSGDSLKEVIENGE